ncbi:MAG: hypothetical protein AAF597_09875, partial [Bacteroidota bacterium]
MSRFLLFSLFLIFTIPVSAQSGSDNPICQDETCSEDLDRIQLNEPRDPVGGQYTAGRLEAFKQAYDQFKRIKDQQEADAGFREKFRTSSLGGRKCLLYYDLDSRFAYEADKNPDFAAYVRQGSDYDAFMRHGFESSRRGMNLNRRLDSNCPKQIRKSEKDGTTDFADRGAVYQHLGVQQGYWDDQGNTLKPLEAVPEPTEPAKRMSKKEQVEQLANQVAALPTGNSTTDKLRDLSQGFQDLVPQATGLQSTLDDLTDKVAEASKKPAGLLRNVTDLLSSKNPLKDFISKIPGSGLVDKIGDFFDKGSRLQRKAEKLKDKASKVQEELDQLKQQATEKGQELGDKAQEITKLEDKLNDLKSKQQELQALLEDKPKRILDELTQKVRDAEQNGRDLLDQLADGNKAKDRLEKELDKLRKQKEAFEDKIADIQ